MPTEADRTTVTVMTAAGIPQDRIAACLGEDGISESTLNKYFRRELEIGQDKVNGIVVSALVKAAQAGEAWAVCFWLKTRMGWREKQDLNHRFVDEGGKDRDLTDAKRELAAEVARIAARTGPQPPS